MMVNCNELGLWLLVCYIQKTLKRFTRIPESERDVHKYD